MFSFPLNYLTEGSIIKPKNEILLKLEILKEIRSMFIVSAQKLFNQRVNCSYHNKLKNWKQLDVVLFSISSIKI